MKATVGDTPVFIGSGIEASTLDQFDAADGFIVGTAFKRGGDIGARVDAARVKEFLARVK
ncbi:MAG: hypothetical protein M3478_02725 [Planctomycetota bacterium]|nr:hypothetical protein [Planctomycetota bacterium]